MPKTEIIVASSDRLPSNGLFWVKYLPTNSNKKVFVYKFPDVQLTSRFYYILKKTENLNVACIRVRFVLFLRSYLRRLFEGGLYSRAASIHDWAFTKWIILWPDSTEKMVLPNSTPKFNIVPHHNTEHSWLYSSFAFFWINLILMISFCVNNIILHTNIQKYCAPKT